MLSAQTGYEEELYMKAASLPFSYFPLNLKEPNYRNEITKQLKLTPHLCFPECTPWLV